MASSGRVLTTLALSATPHRVTGCAIGEVLGRHRDRSPASATSRSGARPRSTGRLLARGKGHAVVHETGIHGGRSPRVIGAIAAAAFVFGSVVLLGGHLG